MNHPSAFAVLSVALCVGPFATSMAQTSRPAAGALLGRVEEMASALGGAARLAPAAVEPAAPKPAEDASQVEINKLIERVRGLQFLGPVDYQALPQAEFAAALAAMGIPGEAARHIQGVYDWETKRLYSNADLSPVQARGTRIHETFHALQDQLFGLEALMRRAQTVDEQYAAKALVEGDASLTFIECMPESRARRMLEIRRPWEFSGTPPSYDDTPSGAAAQVEMVFDYAIAAKFIQAVKERQGWAGVDALYRRPPTSTAQILHPEKYFRHDAPVDVGLPDISGKLPLGWRLESTDVRGEFMTYLMFLKYPATGPEAESLADGWAGDLVRRYSNGANALTVWKSRWETPKDAQEFLDGLRKIHPSGNLSYDPRDNSVLALME